MTKKIRDTKKEIFFFIIFFFLSTWMVFFTGDKIFSNDMRFFMCGALFQFWISFFIGKNEELNDNQE